MAFGQALKTLPLPDEEAVPTPDEVRAPFTLATDQYDPYAPVIGPAVGGLIGDPGSAYIAAEEAYQTGVPAPGATHKGDALAQDLVDLQHSGLASAVGGLMPWRRVR